jgi:hypothetical protein
MTKYRPHATAGTVIRVACVFFCRKEHTSVEFDDHSGTAASRAARTHHPSSVSPSPQFEQGGAPNGG